MVNLVLSFLKESLARLFRPGGSCEEDVRCPDLLLGICQCPDLWTILVSYLDLDSLLQLELVCRGLRRTLVEERLYRDLVSAGVRSGQMVGGGWGWRRQRHSLLDTPSKEETSAHFKRRLIAHHHHTLKN